MSSLIQTKKRPPSKNTILKKQESSKNNLNKLGFHSDNILQLQHQIGNQSIQKLFKPGFIQGKLTIGEPDDKYEKEADEVADKVLRMPEPQIEQKNKEKKKEDIVQAKPAGEQITPLVQRQIEPEEEILQTKSKEQTPQVTLNLESKINSLQGKGNPLSREARNFFEPRFGHDFRAVRIHSDSNANQLARSINAKAFTRGNDVIFGSGEYSPENSKGKRLLGHELTHVVQQNNNILNTMLYRQESKASTKETKKLGIGIDQWWLKIDTELKRVGNKYAIGIVGSISLISLPSKYDDSIKTFFGDLQGELAKYAIGLIPFAGGTLSAIAGAASSTKDKIEASSVKNAFIAFKRGLQLKMLSNIDKLVESSSPFNDKIQERIVKKAKSMDEFIKKAETPSEKEIKKSSEQMTRFIAKEVNIAIFNNAKGSHKHISNKVNSYFQQSWRYFILARLSAESTYSSCKSILMRPESKCDNGFWSWYRYDQKCLHQACKDNLFYYPMPDNWRGPKRQENWGTCGGRFCTWFTVSTGIKQPGGYYTVNEEAYKREKNRYKE